MPRAAVVHLNFRSGSTFPVPFCTVPNGHWVNNQQDQPVQQMLTRSYMLNLLLLKGQRCVMHVLFIIVSQRCMVYTFTLPAALSLTFPPFYHVARCPLPYLPSILSRSPPWSASCLVGANPWFETLNQLLQSSNLLSTRLRSKYEPIFRNRFYFL